MVQEIISFDLCGKFAHFRKYYSSSTALSYTIPPKTTILGLIGAIIELPRDSYYDSFNDWYVSVQIISPIRKMFQKMNYLKVESIGLTLTKSKEQLDATKENDITGEGSRTQVSVELVVPYNIRQETVKYRIYIGVSKSDARNFVKLKRFLADEYNVFGISLGAANMLGYIENYCPSCHFKKIESVEAIVHSSALASSVQLQTAENNFMVEQDSIPLKLEQYDRKGNPTRRASSVKELIYPTTAQGMPVKIMDNTDFYNVENGQSFNIALL
jgi:CRISPR-associated protein Cas5h